MSLSEVKGSVTAYVLRYVTLVEQKFGDPKASLSFSSFLSIVIIIKHIKVTYIFLVVVVVLVFLDTDLL